MSVVEPTVPAAIASKRRQVTFRVDDEALRLARIVAAEKGTTVNQMIREHLADVVNGRAEIRAKARHKQTRQV